MTGLARSTVAQRVDTLLAKGLVHDTGGSVSTGGRPPAVLAFNRDAGVVLVADLGATHARVAVCDLVGTPLAERAGDLDIALGPDRVLEWLDERFTELLDEVGRSRDDVRGIGVGVPGPVEFASGRPVNPPIMPGWDDFPIPEWFDGRYRAPVLVDNDVNIMARGEHRVHWRETEHLLLIKVGTGSAAASSPTATSTGAPAAPRATSGTSGRRAARTSSAGAGTSAASRRSPGARPSPSGSPPRARTQPAAATSSASSGAATPARSAWFATPVEPWARCSPAPSTSSTRR